MDYKIIDKSWYPKTNLFKAVFIRNEENRSLIGRLKWLKLNAIEIIFGAELLENIINTSTDSSERGDQCEYGKKLKLNSFIPSGIFTNMFRSQLLEVLYYKYYKQYQLLRPSDSFDENDIDRTKKVVDCSLIRFASFKEVLHQLVALRRVYEFNHLLFNVMIDISVYVVSNRIDLAILSALLVETVRRILKI
ncbi:TPA: hypothetical protein KD131_004734 [Vibrio parahaemolyticus]|nr:hypothetical protein [Vibrio parahaemolyticus]ELA9727696.1 hypothetical protein [Vibrio parahaemolyticus]HBC3612700.1 hypothetical protein [Vibrio parahaemolyticus]